MVSAAQGQRQDAPHKDWPREATRDPAEHAEWKAAGHNTGIYTGKSGDDGAFLVIDIDVKNGVDGHASFAELQRKHGQLPLTLVHKTPTGGAHYFFTVKKPVASSVAKLGAGLDVRSSGGYVVAPPSATAAGSYTVRDKREIAPSPSWLIELCGRPRERDAKAEAPVANVDQERARQRGIVYLLQEAPLAIEGQGGDQMTYKVSARLKDLGLSATDSLQAMAEHWNPRCSPPWELSDLETKIDNAYRYGQEAPGVAAPEADFTPVATETPKVPPLLDQFALLDRAPIEWLVKDWIPAQGVGFLAGK